MATEKQQRAWLDAARARLEDASGLKRVHLVERIVELEQALGLIEAADPDEGEDEDVALPGDLSELMAAAAATLGGVEGPVAGCTWILAEQLPAPTDLDSHVLNALVAQAYEWHAEDPVDEERMVDEFSLLVAGYHLARRLLGDFAPARGWVEDHDDYDPIGAEEVLNDRLAITVWDDPATDNAFFAAHYFVPLEYREDEAVCEPVTILVQQGFLVSR